nr:uncharacterized protein LOC109175786 [Ipomoea trifida]
MLAVNLEKERSWDWAEAGIYKARRAEAMHEALSSICSKRKEKQFLSPVGSKDAIRLPKKSGNSKEKGVILEKLKHSKGEEHDDRGILSFTSLAPYSAVSAILPPITVIGATMRGLSFLHAKPFTFIPNSTTASPNEHVLHNNPPSHRFPICTPMASSLPPTLHTLSVFSPLRASLSSRPSKSLSFRGRRRSVVPPLRVEVPELMVVACNLAGKWFVEYRNLLLLDHEY